ncbi:MAG: sulfite exporter TauE/SafE family protein [Bacteroidota bacterium]
MDLQTILILCVIGISAGMLSGTVGIGGGVLIVPTLAIFLGMSQVQAQGTSIITMLPPIGILAAINYYRHPEFSIDSRYAVILAGLFVVGAFIGSKFAIKLSVLPNGNARLKLMFGVVILVIAAKMIWDSSKLLMENHSH